MTMIERVGRALAKEEGYAYDPYPYDVRARAAIEAMREPTEAMIKSRTKGLSVSDANSCWRFMVDAALADRPPALPEATRSQA